MDRMPTIYLSEKAETVHKLTSQIKENGSTLTSRWELDEIRRAASSIVQEIDTWRGQEIPSAEVVQTAGEETTEFGDLIVWEWSPVVEGEVSGAGTWLIRVSALTREHAESIAANWSTRTGRGADGEILSAELLPLGIDETNAGAPNWLVVIGDPS